MAIQEKLFEFRFHLAAAAILLAALLYVLTMGPTLSAVVGFFWPLLLSTGFFLAAVAILLRISPPPSDASAEMTGEELIDFVTSRPAETEPAPEEDGEQQRGGAAAAAAEEEELGHQKAQ